MMTTPEALDVMANLASFFMKEATKFADKWVDDKNKSHKRKNLDLYLV